MEIHSEPVLDLPIHAFKRTKIVATVGPSTNSYDLIYKLVKSGANGIRLNFSHGTQEERNKQIKWIRKASDELKKPIAIIQDLQGPKIRLGDFEGAIEVKTGQELVLSYSADYSKTREIPIQYDLSRKVHKGEKLYIFDGKIRTTITDVKTGSVRVKVENDGEIYSRKGINLPDTDFGGDIITDKDNEDISYGAKNDIDYVGMSFIQTPTDIRKLRKILQAQNSRAKIIAKIETKSAINHLDEIIQEADAVMIARGDLATETSPESVPIVQRTIIELAKKFARPSIVATHMLASMTERPEPTRAEVSDVATAVILGADAVMLSDETASGRYPVESVKVMKRVVNYTQKHTPEPIMTHFADVKPQRQLAIPSAIVNLSQVMKAQAIVAETVSGATAIQISSFRPRIPVIAVTHSDRVAQQLAIVYGTKSYVRPVDKKQATKLTDWLLKDDVLSKGDVVITASGQYPGVAGTTDTIKFRVL